MGVPAFFRWLSRKYPSVIAEAIEQMPVDVDGTKIPVDASQPNPNGVEFDNLYLDMNGIIHPCTHPEDKPAPKNEDEMMVAIFECVDRLFRIVRPRKVLYMAIDGVAPCAKMNQQRSRRFRSSKESYEKKQEMARIRQELMDKGAQLPPEKPKESHFDLNCITPGTEFMERLSQCLHYYIHERLNNDPGWKSIKVILSDATVPGEGEHKIMDYIRKQRAQPDHDPNTQHVLCGADADLIMLGLATHEPNFTIIREEFKPNKPRPCDICGQTGHEMKECVGVGEQDAPETATMPFGEDTYIFVRLNVLREYLERELQMPNLPFTFDFERALDDWVFMCFFVGNDFLPHLPSLEIREGAVDRLVTLYKKTIYKTRGWLTDSGDVNLDRVQMIMSDLGQMEDEIFKRRQQKELMFKARNKAQKKRERMAQQKPQFHLLNNTQFAPTPLGGGTRPVQDARKEAYQMRVAGMHTQSGSGNSNNSNNSNGEDQRGGRSRFNDANNAEDKKEESDEEDDQAHDEVRLWEDGFKDRYYESKFDVGPDNIGFRYSVGLQYVRGLCWVLQYYYQGCVNWKWYFPYHYAPFASDFVNISGLSTKFEKNSRPIRPLEQLMSVFPAGSRTLVPEPWAELMTDPKSPVIDFYPEDFKIDLNGKKFAWQGVALLPFVEEKRLFKALAPLYEELTQAETRRNMLGSDRLYVGENNPSFAFLKNLYAEFTKGIRKDENELIGYMSEGVRAFVMPAEDCIDEGGQVNSPIAGLPYVTENSVLCVKYKDPIYSDDFIFPATRLPGAIDPTKVLKPGDLSNEDNRNWRPMIGMSRSNQRASLDQSGHRALNHFTPRHDRDYAAIRPPSQFDDGRRGGGGGSWGPRPAFRGGYQGFRSQQHHPYARPDNRDQGHDRGSRGGYQTGEQDRRNNYPQDRNHDRRGGYQQNRHDNRDHNNRGRQSRDEQNQWGYNSKPGYSYQRR